MSVLKSTVSENVKRGTPKLSTSINNIQGVAIIVGLAGQVSGRVVLDMSEVTALNIASSMNGERLDSLDELASATLTELGNMITGNAVTKLHELGFKFDLTPPALFVGDNLRLTDKIEALVVPLELEEGSLCINVAIKENIYNN
jgi:chemotaxis protein CheX